MKIGCVLRAGEGGPLFLLGVFGDETDYVSSVFNYVREMCPGKSFTLASFEADDWGRDFSPWKAKGCIPGEYFDGGGERTLEWLSGTVNSDFNGGRDMTEYLYADTLCRDFSPFGAFTSALSLTAAPAARDPFGLKAGASSPRVTYY